MEQYGPVHEKIVLIAHELNHPFNVAMLTLLSIRLLPFAVNIALLPYFVYVHVTQV